MAGGGRVRGRDRRLQPAARPGLDRTGDLVRVAGPRQARRAGRRRGVHRAGPDRHSRAVGLVPGHLTANVAVQAGWSLLVPSWRRASGDSGTTGATGATADPGAPGGPGAAGDIGAP